MALRLNDRVLYRPDPRGPWREGVLKGQSFGAARYDVVDSATGETLTVAEVKETE